MMNGMIWKKVGIDEKRFWLHSKRTSHKSKIPKFRKKYTTNLWCHDAITTNIFV